MSRRTLNATWLLIGLVVVGLLAARYARAYGVLGIVVPLVGIASVVAVIRLLGPWTIGWPRPAPRQGPRDVTPPEPTLASTGTISARPSPGQVVVIDPEHPTAESLEERLATVDRLHADGRLTDAEYAAKRAQLIADY